MIKLVKGSASECKERIKLVLSEQELEFIENNPSVKEHLGLMASELEDEIENIEE